MPLYEYECNVCQDRFERLCPLEQRNDPPMCPTCGCGDSSLIIGTPSFDPKMGCDPDFPTAWARWGKKHKDLGSGKMKSIDNSQLQHDPAGNS